MVLRTRPAAAFVFFLAVTVTGKLAVAQIPSAPAQPGTMIGLASAFGQDGTRYQYEISQERAYGLPLWDQRASSEPPLSMLDARKAAEFWLTSRTPEVKTFEIASLSLLKVAPRAPGPCTFAGCWYYRVSFDPVIGGRRLAGSGDFTVVVLLDGSIVEPRVEVGPGQLPGLATPAFGAPAVPPSMPVRAGGPVPPPLRLKNVNPVYPPEAQTDRVQGLVIIEATIGVDGKVQDARVLRSIPRLDAAALEAVRQWEYAPTLLNGVPVPVIMAVTVNFTLQ